MGIAIFHASLPEPGRKLGGVELTVHRLANALVEHEHCEVTLFSCSDRPSDALYQHKQVGSKASLTSKLYRLVYLPAQLNTVDFTGFDVLHLHGDDWFFVKRRLPTVRTLHGSALFEARFAQNWRRKLLQYAVYPLEHLSARLASLPVAVGLEAAALYRTAGLADNGVDTQVFRPVEKDPEPLLIYVGLWRGRKRGSFAFDLFVNEVAPRWPTARMIMVCDHVPNHPRVVDGGFPTQAVLAEWMASAWIFLYPSVYEGFGIPYVEALASSTAVVTSPNSGANYVLEQGRFGMILTDDGIAAGLQVLLENADARRDLEIRGLQRADYFSWPNVARQHVTLYRQAIQRFRA